MKDRLIALLRWSERYTKTDMVYLASGGFWLTTEQILLGLMALGVSVAFARIVSPATYGTYRFLLSLFWTLSAFSLTGLAGALSRAIARGEEGAYRQAIPLSVAGSLPMAIIAGGIALYYFSLGNPTLGWGAAIICVAAPLYQSASLFGSYLEGKKDFRRTALFGVFFNLIPTLFLLLLLPFARTPLPFLAAYLGGNIIAALVLSWAAVRIHRPNKVKSPGLQNLSWHLSVVNILGTISTQLDQLLVFHYLGAAELATYSFATSMPDQFKNMVSNLANIAFPKFVGRPIAEIQKTLAYRIAMLTLVLAASLAIYLVLAPFFFHLLFPAYPSAIWYSQIYAVTLIASGSLVPVAALQAHAAKRELYIFNIVSAIVQIGSMLGGILLWGLLGLILARGVSRLFNLALGTLLLRLYAKRAAV